MTKPQTYIGVKLVSARPMTRGQYCEYRWDVPPDEDEDPSDDGYLVEYLDGGKPNDERHEGYISWCPRAQFEKANRPLSGMPFGHAIEAAKAGHKIARRGWNGKNMFVVYMPPLWLPPYSSQKPGAKVNDRTARHIGTDTPLDSQAYLAMYTAQKQWIPGWVASQSDMLADDWYIVAE